jgi:monoamine oxidase
MRYLMSVKVDVVVIGGGFAGVTAARDVKDAGHSVVLLESRPRLGGRTWYRPFCGAGESHEIGGAYIHPEIQPSLEREMKRYGIAARYVPEAQHYFWRVDGELVKGFPLPLEEMADLERALFHMIAASRRVTFGEAPVDVDDLDVPLEEFLAALELRPATLDFLLAWGDLIAAAPAERGSALQIFYWLAGLGNSAWGMFASLSEKVDGGTKSILDAMVTTSELDVRLSDPVLSVAQDSSGVTVMTQSGATYQGECAVVAVPLNCLGDVVFEPELSPAKRAAISKGHVGVATKPLVLIDNIPEMPFCMGRGGPFEVLIPGSQLAEGTLFECVPADPSLIDMDDTAAVQEAVRYFLPEAVVVAVDHHDWVRDPFSKGSWVSWAPGDMPAYLAELQTPEDRVVLAGSDISRTWFGWIEGAIESGTSAAAHVLARLR